MFQSYGVILTDSSLNTIIVQQYGQSWCFPKGHLEQGETGMSCATREFKEETGCKIDKLAYIIDPVFKLGGVKEPIATTITRETYRDGIWLDKQKLITYYLARTKSLDALDFSNVRDQAITDMRIINLTDLSDKAEHKSGLNHYYVEDEKDSFTHNGEHFVMHHKDRRAVFDLVAYTTKRKEESIRRISNN